LIVLVAMTLSALALIRSVNITNLVSGNLAFRESAVLSAERSTEIALDWLASKSGTVTDEDGITSKNVALFTNDTTSGYFASRADPASAQSWDAFWDASLKTHAVSGVADVAGNTVSYVIHRLCKNTGLPKSAECSKPPFGSSGNSYVPGSDVLPTSSQIYYRITTRVAGPRNTVVYTQTIIAL
jgi:hypothetical protein